MFRIYLSLKIRIFLLFWFEVLKNYDFGLGLEFFNSWAEHLEFFFKLWLMV